MSEFTPITTQDQLDAIIGERIKRERSTISKQYEGYLSPEAAAEKYKDYLSPEAEAAKYKGYLSPEEAAKKDAQIKRYETDSVKTRIARELSIPYELAARLNGDTEDDIRKDAQALSKILRAAEPIAPLRSTEPDGADNKRAALRALATNLADKGE